MPAARRKGFAMLMKVFGVAALAAVVGGCGSTQTRTGGSGGGAWFCSCEACSCEGCDGTRCAGCPSPAGQAGSGGDGGATELTSYSSEPIAGDQAVVFVDGMACPMCATNVDLKLRELPGVADARVNLELGSVVVDLEGPMRPSSAQLAKAVDDSGFTLSKIVIR